MDKEVGGAATHRRGHKGEALHPFGELSPSLLLRETRDSATPAFSLSFLRLPPPSLFWVSSPSPLKAEDDASCLQHKTDTNLLEITETSSSLLLKSLLLPKCHGEEAGVGRRALVLDEDGRYLPSVCEQLLFFSSLCLIINPLVAFYYGCIAMGYLSLLLFLTSIFHWWKPRFGLRRTIDIFTARVVVLTFCGVAITTAPSYACALYLWGLLLVLGLHAMGWHFARTKRHLEGTVCHICLHLVGTTVNVFLFSVIGDESFYQWSNN